MWLYDLFTVTLNYNLIYCHIWVLHNLTAKLHDIYVNIFYYKIFFGCWHLFNKNKCSDLVIYVIYYNMLWNYEKFHGRNYTRNSFLVWNNFNWTVVLVPSFGWGRLPYLQSERPGTMLEKRFESSENHSVYRSCHLSCIQPWLK